MLAANVAGRRARQIGTRNAHANSSSNDEEDTTVASSTSAGSLVDTLTPNETLANTPTPIRKSADAV